MATEGPGPDPDVDEEFARIIAGWDDVAPTSGSALLPPSSHPSESAAGVSGDGPPHGSLPAVDPVPTDNRHDAPAAASGGVEPRPDEPAASEHPDEPAASEHPDEPAYQPEADPWRGYVPDEEPDEHFEPPEPELPPAHDATYWLAVVGMAAGPILVLWAVVFSGDPDPGWMVMVGLLLFAFGFGLLVMRGSGERDPDDDGSRL